MRKIHPISGPCVWHGREMANSPRWRRRIGDAQLAEIDLAVRQARARGLGWQTMTADDFPLPSFSALAEAAQQEMPQRGLIATSPDARSWLLFFWT
jgi:hypothetical protein